MTFKSLDFIKKYFTHLICAILILKVVFFQVTTAESLSTLFILTALQVARIIDYKFPLRPDLFQDVTELKSKLESLESDVNGLKLRDLKK